jgi:hypothetical protein
MQKFFIPLLSIGLLLSSITINAQKRTPIQNRAQENNLPAVAHSLVDQVSHFLAGNDQEEKQITQTILHNFAHMVGSFLQIVQDPHNPETITQNIGSMVTDIGNIITQALKTGFKNRNISHRKHALTSACKNYMSKNLDMNHYK